VTVTAVPAAIPTDLAHAYWAEACRGYIAAHPAEPPTLLPHPRALRPTWRTDGFAEQMEETAGALWVPGTRDVESLIEYWKGAEPGWFPDPLRTDALRFWNGKGWSKLDTPWAFAGWIPPPPPAVKRRRWSGLVQKIQHRIRRHRP